MSAPTPEVLLANAAAEVLKREGHNLLAEIIRAAAPMVVVTTADAAAPSAPQGGGVDGRTLAKARDAWQSSDEGRMLANDINGPVGGQCLRNRLEVAFCAGYEAALTAQPRTDAAQQPPAEAQGGGEVVAWFPTNGAGEILRNYGDGSPVYACKTKEQAEQVRRCHLGAAGPVIPLYAAPPSAPVGVDEPPKGWNPCSRCRLKGKSDDCERCGGSGWRKKCNALDCLEYGCNGYGFCLVTKDELAAALAQQPAALSGEAWSHYAGSVLTSGADNEASVSFAFSSRDEAERFHEAAIAMLAAAPQQPAAVEGSQR